MLKHDLIVHAVMNLAVVDLDENKNRFGAFERIDVMYSAYLCEAEAGPRAVVLRLLCKTGP